MTKEALDDYKAKISLKYITQTKDEMLREVKKKKEANKLHAVKTIIATSITETLTIPSPNTEEDAEYMEKLGFILDKDNDGKYHVELDKVEKDSHAERYINLISDLRKDTANTVMKKIKEEMANNEHRAMITTEIYDKPYENRNRLKYFDVWLSPELEKAGFKPTLIDANHYSITW